MFGLKFVAPKIDVHNRFYLKLKFVALKFKRDFDNEISGSTHFCRTMFKRKSLNLQLIIPNQFYRIYLLNQFSLPQNQTHVKFLFGLL